MLRFGERREESRVFFFVCFVVWKRDRKIVGNVRFFFWDFLAIFYLNRMVKFCFSKG